MKRVSTASAEEDENAPRAISRNWFMDTVPPRFSEVLLSHGGRQPRAKYSTKKGQTCDRSPLSLRCDDGPAQFALRPAITHDKKRM